MKIEYTMCDSCDSKHKQCYKCKMDKHDICNECFITVKYTDRFEDGIIIESKVCILCLKDAEVL